MGAYFIPETPADIGAEPKLSDSVSGAITGANTPSATNPFATSADLEALSKIYKLDPTLTSINTPYILGSNAETRLIIDSTISGKATCYVALPNIQDVYSGIDGEGNTVAAADVAATLIRDQAIQIDTSLNDGVDTNRNFVFSTNINGTSKELVDIGTALGVAASGWELDFKRHFVVEFYPNVDLTSSGWTPTGDGGVLFAPIDSDSDGLGNAPRPDINGNLRVFTLDEAEYNNVAGLGTASQEDVNYFVPASTAATNHVPAGFPNHNDTTLSLVENVGGVNDTFAVTITGTDFPVFIDSLLAIKNTGTVTQVGALSKRYFIYYNPAGTLTIVDSTWNLDDFDGSCFVATVLWDAVTHQGILEEERHHSWRDTHWHHWGHHTVGAQYSTAHHANAFTLSNPAANQYATFSISAGTIYDEDIPNDMGSAATTCNLFYHHTNGTMRWDAASTTPYKLSGGVPVVDTGTSLVTKNGSNTTGYFVSWVYGTNAVDAADKIAVVIGQDSDNAMTLTEAQNAAFPTLPVGFILEWKLLYKMIFRYGSGNNLTHISNTDYRISGALPSGQAPTSNISASAVSAVPTAPATGTNVQAQLDERPVQLIQETRTGLTPTNAGISTLDLSLSRAFKLDASGLAAGNAFTVAFSNIPTGAVVVAATVILKTGTNVPTVTWPTGVTAPTLSASKTAWFTLATDDNGTTWRLFSAGAF